MPADSYASLRASLDSCGGPACHHGRGGRRSSGRPGHRPNRAHGSLGSRTGRDDLPLLQLRRLLPERAGFTAVVLAQALVLRATLARRPFEGIDWRVASPLGALVAYAAWKLLSARWSHAPARALDAFDLTLLYLLGLTLYGSLANSDARLRWLLRALVAAMAGVCVVGLVTRVLPHLWPTSSAFGNDRLDYPLSYWNAEGMLAAATIVLLLHLSSDTDEPAVVRTVSAALVPPTAAALLLTFSRGALGVTALALITYVLLGRPRGLLSSLIAVLPTSAIALKAAWDAQLLAQNDLGSTSAPWHRAGTSQRLSLPACLRVRLSVPR